MPTPPFWFATTMIRGESGCGSEPVSRETSTDRSSGTSGRKGSSSGVRRTLRGLVTESGTMKTPHWRLLNESNPRIRQEAFANTFPARRFSTSVAVSPELSTRGRDPARIGRSRWMRTRELSLSPALGARHEAASSPTAGSGPDDRSAETPNVSRETSAPKWRSTPTDQPRGLGDATRATRTQNHGHHRKHRRASRPTYRAPPPNTTAPSPRALPRRRPQLHLEPSGTSDSGGCEPVDPPHGR